MDGVILSDGPPVALEETVNHHRHLLRTHARHVRYVDTSHNSLGLAPPQAHRVCD